MLRAILFFAAAASACTMSQTLRAGGAKHGIMMGVAARDTTDNTYNSKVKEQFDLIVAENACKMDSTEPSRNNFNFGGCDRAHQLAVAGNSTFRGHCLVWGQQVPGWVNSLSTADKQAAMVNHIKTMATHYKGQVYSWDVVNEAIADGSASLKSTVWSSIPNYIDLAFQTAHDADPNAKLIYNDYSMDTTNTKSNYAYDMVSKMLKNGIPIHGVGFQAHLGSGDSNAASFTNNWKRFTALGLEVHITELDVGGGGNTAVFHAVMQACLDPSVKCKSYGVWGLRDPDSWRTGENPLLFDGNYNPKQAACDLATQLA